MAIKSKESSTGIKAISFPKLMISNNGTVVLMNEDASGTALTSNRTSFYKVGHYATDWIMGSFVDYNGTITLENE